MLVASLAALAVASSGWVIGGQLPPKHILLYADQQADGTQSTYYGVDVGDVFDAPLVLNVGPPGGALKPDTAVHGLPADLDDLTDEGTVYGRSVRWDEAGVRLSVEWSGAQSDPALLALAESVVAVPAERWQALVTATSLPPQRPPAGSKPVSVASGLTALLPPGFPVAPEDRRVACLRVRYHGARSTECRFPAWRRVAGRVFVFGPVAPSVKRVRVNGVKVRTVAAAGYPLARFYKMALPSKTCEVRIVDADRRRLIDLTGPAAGGPVRDKRRCLRKR